jgi:hypothetical protein
MENLIAHGEIMYSVGIMLVFLMLFIGIFVFYEIKRKKENKLKEIKDGGRSNIQFSEKEE